MRWVIGDIHGMLRPLEALVRAIDRADADRRLIFVGDYINRGPDSKGVIDLLLSLPNTICLRGNHDDIFDEVLSCRSYVARPGEEHREMSFKWFMQHGMDKTLLSYGISADELERAVKHPSGRRLDELTAPVPAAHRQFIRDLPAVLEMDDLFIAHAKWDINTPTQSPSIADQLKPSETLRYAIVWGRYTADEVRANKMWERQGYFGHTPVDVYQSGDLLPIVGPKIVLLDTAVALVAHGRLTAVCHETGSFLQVDVSGKIVTGA